MRHESRHGAVLAAMALLATAQLTSCIDEDLSDCGKDYTITYHVVQDNNVEEEMADRLTTPLQQRFAAELRTALAGVFTDDAADNDLTFFAADGTTAYHSANPMGGSQATYTLYMKRADYRNLAVANTAAETVATLSGSDAPTTLSLRQPDGATVESHTHGLFASRLSVAADDFSRHLDAWLYMQNCAAAVFIDMNGVKPEAVAAFVTGTAASFAVNDSTYTYDRDFSVTARTVAQNDDYCGLAAVAFPSRDTAEAWQMHVVARIGGKYTETTLKSAHPLPAGKLRVLTVKMNGDGSVTPTMADVGVSVDLDWKPGGDHDIDI